MLLIHKKSPKRYELSERLLKDLALAQVADVDVVGSGSVLFLSSTTQVLGSDIATVMLADADADADAGKRTITISSSSSNCGKWTSHRSSTSF